MFPFVLWIGIFLASCTNGADLDKFSWKVIGVGSTHSCVVPQDGILRCWGANDSGQLGDGSFVERSLPTKVDGKWSGRIQTLAMGYAHTCAIDGDHFLYCWGDNSFGQLGNKNQSGRLSPQRVNLGEGQRVEFVATGYAHTCAVLRDGSLMCWGFNGSGQLGDGSTEDRFIPVSVNLGKDRLAKRVAVGFSHTCVLLDDHSIQCWGANDSGQLGDGTIINSPVPVAVSIGWGDRFGSLVAGDSHTCALNDIGILKCWGSNHRGQLGDGSEVDRTRAVRVKWKKSGYIRTVVAGKDYTCGVGDDGILSCWGGNAYGQLGNGSTLPHSLPEPVDLGGGRSVLAVAAGEAHLCAKLSDDSLVCWGNNGRGQLGDGVAREYRGSVVEGSFEAVVTGNAHSCALREDGGAECWGGNNFGQLGDGSRVDRHGPVVVSLPTGRTAKAIGAGCDHTCGILDDDSLACWGKNSFGQLGNGIVGDRSTPVVVDLQGQMVREMTLGCEHTCVVLDDDFRMCWGELSLEQVREYAHGCQIGKDARLVCRGDNRRGQLGGNTPHRGDDPGEMGNNLPGILIYW